VKLKKKDMKERHSSLWNYNKIMIVIFQSLEL